MRELERLRGTWVAVGVEMKGVRVPDEEVRREKLRLVITGDRFAIKVKKGDEDETRLQGKLELDPRRLPTVMDLSVPRPTGGGMEKVEGIYELEGDTLRFCYGKERPEEFTTDSGNVSGYERRLYIFERR